MAIKKGSSGPQWPDETIARLRALWEEGLSENEIGRRLGKSKNAVVGKVHRLDPPVTPRPSPIKRSKPYPEARQAKVQPVRVGKVSLPPLPSVA